MCVIFLDFVFVPLCLFFCWFVLTFLLICAFLFVDLCFSLCSLVAVIHYPSCACPFFFFSIFLFLYFCLLLSYLCFLWSLCSLSICIHLSFSFASTCLSPKQNSLIFLLLVTRPVSPKALYGNIPSTLVTISSLLSSFLWVIFLHYCFYWLGFPKYFL